MAGPAAASGLSLQGELTWQEGLDQQGEREAQVRGARLQPLPAVRAAALGVPQVRPVPGVSARDGAPRRTPRHHQVQLVTDRDRRRSGPSGPETTAGKRHYDHDDDRPHRRHADPSACQLNCLPRHRGNAVQQAQVAHRGDPETGRLHRLLAGPRQRRPAGGEDPRTDAEVRSESGRSIAGVRRVSKPGLRVYAKSTNMPRCSADWVSRSSPPPRAC